MIINKKIRKKRTNKLCRVKTVDLIIPSHCNHDLIIPNYHICNLIILKNNDCDILIPDVLNSNSL